MDLRQLRYFIALNEHRSFVRAAEAMGITQPAFSRSIQGLEQEFRCQLVDRANKELRPTPEGQVLLQHAWRLVQGATQLVAEVSQMTKLDAGEVRFGCGPAPAARLVPDTLAAFTRSYPGVRCQFHVDNWERLSRALNRDEIEFFIADIRHFEADPHFQTQALNPRSGMFYCRPGHPLLHKESLTTHDLFAYPLATGLIPPGVRKLLANLSGRDDFTTQVESEHFPALRAVVEQTDAIGISTEEACAEALAAGRIQRLHWRNLPTSLHSLAAQCGIVTRSGFRLSAAARALLETLGEVDRALHPPMRAAQ